MRDAIFPQGDAWAIILCPYRGAMMLLKIFVEQGGKTERSKSVEDVGLLKKDVGHLDEDVALL